jgi:hypothetical protein
MQIAPGPQTQTLGPLGSTYAPIRTRSFRPDAASRQRLSVYFFV